MNAILARALPPVVFALVFCAVLFGLYEAMNAAQIGRPPVGLNVYVVRSASPVPLTLEQVFAGVMPFLCMDLITLALLIIFPSIVLFLPNLMM